VICDGGPSSGRGASAWFCLVMGENGRASGVDVIGAGMMVVVVRASLLVRMGQMVMRNAQRGKGSVGRD